MPFIHVEMLDGRSQDQKKEIAEVLTQNLARIVNCRVDDVQVVITEVSRQNWSTGGVLQCDQ